MPCVKPVLVSRYIQHQNNVTSAERPNLTGCPSIYMFNYGSLALLVEQWLSVSELMQGSPEGPATGDFLRVLKRITPATNFGSILFLVQHFKCIFYRNKKAK